MYADKQNGNKKCWKDSRYCNSEYDVERGEINNGSGGTFDAYKIFPAAVKATQFTASHTHLMFKVSSPTFSKYTAFEYKEGVNGGPASFIELEEFTAVDGEYVTTDVRVSQLSGPKIYFVTPSNAKPSIYPDPPAGTTTQFAHIFTKTLNSDTQAALYAQLFDVSPKAPFKPSSGWNEGPDKHNHKYGFRRTFTRVVKMGGSMEGVVWQDQSDWKIYVTWFTSTGHDNVELPNPGSHYLVATAGDEEVSGHIIYSI